MTALIYDFNKIVNANSLFLLHKQHPGSHPSSHGSSQYWSIFSFTLRNFLLLHWWRWHIPFEVILRSVPFSYVSPSYLQPWDPKNNQANYIFKPINDLLLNFSQVLVYIRSNVKECDWSIGEKLKYTSIWYAEIGYFQIAFCLFSKKEFSCKKVFWKWVWFAPKWM